MDFKSKRVWFGILAGMVVTVICGLLRFTCGSVLLGPIVGAYIGKISGPKQGAVIGAIVILPVAVLSLLQMQKEVIYDLNHFPFTTIVALVVLPLLFAAIGALVGAIVGLAFRALKGKQLLF